VTVVRYLVVANQTLGGDHLLDQVRDCLRDGPCRFHIVVPATHPLGSWTEGAVRSAARQRLEVALDRFAKAGIEATGEVGDPSPILAVKDALLAGTYDVIILSTLPPGVSKWLKKDLPHRLVTLGLPVIHVSARLEPAPR
jgi:hypothetical protein